LQVGKWILWMLNVIEATRFRRDVKRLRKGNKDINKLQQIILSLCSRTLLSPKYRDHVLTGNWVGHRECHIEPDWLLIYKIDEETLQLVRTGSHTELFD
jgi:mRNA interferase YafQ